jgi:hypothetical protein
VYIGLVFTVHCCTPVRVYTCRVFTTYAFTAVQRPGCTAVGCSSFTGVHCGQVFTCSGVQPRTRSLFTAARCSLLYSGRLLTVHQSRVYSGQVFTVHCGQGVQRRTRSLLLRSGVHRSLRSAVHLSGCTAAYAFTVQGVHLARLFTGVQRSAIHCGNVYTWLWCTSGSAVHCSLRPGVQLLGVHRSCGRLFTCQGVQPCTRSLFRVYTWLGCSPFTAVRVFTWLWCTAARCSLLTMAGCTAVYAFTGVWLSGCSLFTMVLMCCDVWCTPSQVGVTRA